MKAETLQNLTIRLLPSQLAEAKKTADKLGKKPRVFMRESILNAINKSA